jgi:hypothetical protein
MRGGLGHLTTWGRGGWGRSRDLPRARRLMAGECEVLEAVAARQIPA